MLAIAYDESSKTQILVLMDLKTGHKTNLIAASSSQTLQATWAQKGDSIVALINDKAGNSKLTVLANADPEGLTFRLKEEIDELSTPQAGHVAYLHFWKNGQRGALALDLPENSLRPVPSDSRIPLGTSLTGQAVLRKDDACSIGEICLIKGDTEEPLLHRASKAVSAIRHIAISGEHHTISNEAGDETYSLSFRAREWNGSTVVYLHGGPHSHIGDCFHGEIQYLVAEGFNVLAPNYRGSTGYGTRYQNKLALTGCGTGELDDVQAVITWGIEQGLAVPGRIGLMGSSYGGYLTWSLLVSLPRHLVGAGVIVNGLSDLVLDYETTQPEIRTFMTDLMGGNPDTQPQRYLDASPIHFLHRLEAPVLVFHGIDDTNVAFSQAQRCFESLRILGRDCELVELAGQGHSLQRQEIRHEVIRRASAFLTRSLA